MLRTVKLPDEPLHIQFTRETHQNLSKVSVIELDSILQYMTSPTTFQHPINQETLITSSKRPPFDDLLVTAQNPTHKTLITIHPDLNLQIPLVDAYALRIKLKPPAMWQHTTHLPIHNAAAFVIYVTLYQILKQKRFIEIATIAEQLNIEGCPIDDAEIDIQLTAPARKIVRTLQANLRSAPEKPELVVADFIFAPHISPWEVGLHLLHIGKANIERLDNYNHYRLTAKPNQPGK